MNSLTDPDFLASLPVGALADYRKRKQETEEQMQRAANLLARFPQLCSWLEAQGIETKFDFRYNSFDVPFTGDGPRLALVWRELRRCGWTCSSHPKKGDTTFAAFFQPPSPDLPQIFVNFSSNLCKRVQVGTKLVEQPVYETQCGEMDYSALPPPSTSVVPA